MHRSLALLSLCLTGCAGEVVEGTGVPATTGASTGETSGDTTDASASGTPTDGNTIEGDDCTSACVRLRSCLELLTLDPALPDGVYTIDPEGDGTTLSVYCDMKNGGWTVLVSEDLDTPMGWSMGGGSQCGGIGSLLGGSGQFGAGAAITKTFPLLGVPHTQLGALAVVAIIDSWDGESMTLEVDNQVLATMACQHNPPSCNQGAQECGMPQWPDGQIALNGVLAHATDSALVKVSSTLDQDSGNEAWGLNTLLVYVR